MGRRNRLFSASCRTLSHQKLIVSLRLIEPPLCRTALAGRLMQLTGEAQAIGRHVVVDVFVVASSNQVCLVPDAHVTIAGDRPVEGFPGRKMSARRIR